MPVAVLIPGRQSVSEGPNQFTVPANAYVFIRPVGSSDITNPGDLPTNAGIFYVQPFGTFTTGGAGGVDGTANSASYLEPTDFPEFSVSGDGPYGTGFAYNEHVAYSGDNTFAQRSDAGRYTYTQWTRSLIVDNAWAPVLVYGGSGTLNWGAEIDDYVLDVAYFQTVSVTPGAAAAGATVIINALGGDGSFGAYNPVVLFGGVPATDVLFWDVDQIQCVVPAGAGTVDIEVQVQFDTLFAGTVTVSSIATNAFTYGSVPALEMDETEAVGALLVGNVGGVDDDMFVFNGVRMDSDVAVAALKVGGQTEFEFFSPSTPTVQNGGSWRLHSFTFKYRQEEVS